MTDIMLASTHSDCAILNSGTLRSDRIHPKGDFKLRDLVTIMPMMDPMIVLAATGFQIWKALENGVSQWPKLEGRFPQVSGIRFAFDPRKEPKNRIDPRHIKIGDEYLDLEMTYRLVTKGYLHQGKDGYTILKDCEVLVDEEDCPELCTSIQNHFEAIRIVKDPKSKPYSRHRQSLMALSRRSSAVKMLEMGSTSPGEPIDIPIVTSGNMSPSSPLMHRNSVITSAKKQSSTFSLMDGINNYKKSPRKMSIDEIEYEQCRLEPKIEGRIIIINDEVQKLNNGLIR